MKHSNILIIGLLAIILLFVAGSNLVLKAEFEKIDQKDPFSGYKREILKPFSYVKINGKQVGVTQIQPGAAFQIHYITDRKMLDWKINGDTLELTHKAISDEAADRYFDFDSKPAIYISAPKLSGVDVSNTVNIIKGWKTTDFILNQKGKSTLLTENSISNLSARLNSGGYLLINGKNKIGKSNILVKDSSELSSDKDVFNSFEVSVDSLAKIKLPGSLYKKITKL
ncbi:hypothetical protein [Dyadobacter frigoris]|uniref:Uncharacterized protein n=1 Tax=Dyadobacter frigoris TaxID=2576211 RepID=A0A4U6D0M1_9BACT|nr:hypothetical protein [Dyadobacter frigoris]TKT90740.1 hypothetical protein FDK13_17380 [Dyadobacter frigoris]GLU52073.1 hypothetical protein Dfri01_15340 [Dyadobacter frigoris]